MSWRARRRASAFALSGGNESSEGTKAVFTPPEFKPPSILLYMILAYLPAPAEAAAEANGGAEAVQAGRRERERERKRERKREGDKCIAGN